MPSDSKHDAWSMGDSYEHYMGRWSRKIAASYLEWLKPPAQVDWLEIGCGTGALTNAILAKADPKSVLATDQSEDFVKHAQKEIADPRAAFGQAQAQNLPAADASVDVVTSALVLNFVPERPAALHEMQRVLRPGGLFSFYVWDYPGGGMGFIDAFWTAAAEVDPAAAELNESARFPFCTRSGLRDLCSEAGLAQPEVAPIEIATVFPDFEAFWKPFTMGAGPAPGYCGSLDPDHRDALKAALARQLDSGGEISLPARAWAARANI